MNSYMLRRALVIIALLFVALVSRTLLLGGSKYVTLEPAPPLAGVISQGLISTGSTPSLPVPDKDFTIDDTYYFKDPAWVAVSIVQSKQSDNVALLILHTTGGIYRVVLGPGTAFPASYLQALPADVGQYLQDKGAVYESSN
jgi:hypothetical protein